MKKNFVIIFLCISLLIILCSNLSAQPRFQIEFGGETEKQKEKSPDKKLLEDFNDISDGYYIYSGQDAQIGIDKVMDENDSRLEISFDIRSFNYSENWLVVRKSFGRQGESFNSYDAIELWIKSDGSGGRLDIAFEDNNRRRWEYHNSTVLGTKNKWIKLKIPFNLGVTRSFWISDTAIDWNRIDSIYIGVSLPDFGVRKPLPFKGSILVDKITLVRKGTLIGIPILEYLPNGYLITEFYTDEEMKVIKEDQKDNWGIYQTINLLDRLVFFNDFSFNYKIGIPARWVLAGSKIKQKGEDYRLYYPDEDENVPRFAVTLKEIYLLYSPVISKYIRRIQLGTHHITWSPINLMGCDQLVGARYEGFLAKMLFVDLIGVANSRTDRYFGGIRIKPGFKNDIVLSSTFILGRMYLKSIDTEGNIVDKKQTAEDYSLSSIEISKYQKNIFFFNNIKLYAGYSTMVEKDYGGRWQSPEKEGKDFIFIGRWDKPHPYNGDFLRTGTILDFSIFYIESEYRYITKDFGGFGYKEELLRWMNDTPAHLLNIERRREMSFIQWKYRRLVRESYDNQKGVHLKTAMDFRKKGKIESELDFSSEVKNPDISETRLQFGYSRAIKWFVPYYWWRSEFAYNGNEKIFNTQYHEIACTINFFTFVEFACGYQKAFNKVDDSTKSTIFTELMGQILPNVILRFRVKLTDPQKLNKDLKGLESEFRHADIKEYIDHMPDQYIQVLLKIEI